MLTKLLVAIPILAGAGVASAEITDVWVERIIDDIIWPPPNVFSYDLKVAITEGDAWTCAGGPAVGQPWITYNDGIFYQSHVNDGNPPNPAFFPFFPDTEYTSFYTTHLGWPNVADQGVGPGFAYGPEDTDHALVADWFWTPDGNDYPGEFTIARFTIIADDPTALTFAHIDMLIGSRETVPAIPFQAHIPIPEPGSLALLALGGLALLRRR